MNLELSEVARTARVEEVRDRFSWVTNSHPKWVGSLGEIASTAEDRSPSKGFRAKAGKFSVRSHPVGQVTVLKQGVGRSIVHMHPSVDIELVSVVTRRKLGASFPLDANLLIGAYGLAKEDALTLIAASTVKIPPKRSHDFPSDSLVQYVIEKARADANEHSEVFEPDWDAARQHIRKAVFGLLRVMGQSSSAEVGGERRSVLLSKDGKFVPAVAEALLARISVSYYQSFEFTNKLHEELLDVAPISGNGWILSRIAPSALEVRPVDVQARSRLPEVGRRKARVVRFGAAT